MTKPTLVPALKTAPYVVRVEDDVLDWLRTKTVGELDAILRYAIEREKHVHAIEKLRQVIEKHKASRLFKTSQRCRNRCASLEYLAYEMARRWGLDTPP